MLELLHQHGEAAVILIAMLFGVVRFERRLSDMRSDMKDMQADIVNLKDAHRDIKLDIREFRTALFLKSGKSGEIGEK